MKKNTLAILAGTALALGGSGCASTSHYTFPPSEKVTVEKVRFQNRFRIEVAGDLYMPENIDRTRKYAAVIVGHPFGGVKEQTSGLYAQKLAELGYITLAFDASHYGESGGEPRYIESPETRVEDFSRRFPEQSSAGG